MTEQRTTWTTIFRRAGRRGWTLRWRVPGAPWRSSQHRTRTEAETVRDRITQGGPGAALTLREYAARWLARCRQRVAPATVGQYAWALDGHILPALGARALDRIGPGDVKDLVSAMVEEARLGRASIGHVRAVLHACLGEAVEDGYIARNPAAFRQRGRRDAQSVRREIRAFTPEQLARLLERVDALLDSRAALLFRLLALTGLRPGEGRALQWPDVDLERGELLVRRGISGAAEREVTKTGRERRVDVAEGLRARLRTWDAQTKAEALQEGTERPAWVFARGGSWLRETACRDAFRRAVRAARLPPHHTPYSLRHSYASILLARGVSIQYVQQQLGHSRIGQTVDTYGSWLPLGDRGVVTALEADLSGPLALLSGTTR